MKTTTLLIKYLLDNSKCNLSYRPILAGKRRSGKSTAALYGALLRGLEAHHTKYRILIIVNSLSQKINIENQLRHIIGDVLNIKMDIPMNGCIRFNINKLEVFDIDVFTSGCSESLRGRIKYDFGIIEELNSDHNWKDSLNIMLTMTDDFIMTSNAEL